MFNLDTRQFDIFIPLTVFSAPARISSNENCVYDSFWSDAVPLEDILLVGCELPKLLSVTQTVDYEDRWTHNTSISTNDSREVKVMEQSAQALEQVLVLECNMHSEIWNWTLLMCTSFGKLIYNQWMFHSTQSFSAHFGYTMLYIFSW